MNIHVHIERLVLDGLPVSAADRPIVQASVQAELARLLTSSGLGPTMASGGAHGRVAGAGLRYELHPDSGILGRRIAGAVHEGMNR